MEEKACQKYNLTLDIDHESQSNDLFNILYVVDKYLDTSSSNHSKEFNLNKIKINEIFSSDKNNINCITLCEMILALTYLSEKKETIFNNISCLSEESIGFYISLIEKYFNSEDPNNIIEEDEVSDEDSIKVITFRDTEQKNIKGPRKVSFLNDKIICNSSSQVQFIENLNQDTSSQYIVNINDVSINLNNRSIDEIGDNHSALNSELASNNHNNDNNIIGKKSTSTWNMKKNFKSQFSIITDKILYSDTFKNTMLSQNNDEKACSQLKMEFLENNGMLGFAHDLSDQIIILENELKKSKNSEISNKAKISRLSNIIHKLKEEVSELSYQISLFKNNQLQINISQEELQREKDDKDKLKQEIQLVLIKMEDNSNAFIIKEENYKTEIHELLNKIEQKNINLAQMDNILKDNEKLKKQIDELSYNNSNNNKQTLEIKLNTISKTLEEANKEKIRLSRRIDLINNDLHKKDDIIKDLNKDLNHIKSNFNEYRKSALYENSSNHLNSEIFDFKKHQSNIFNINSLNKGENTRNLFKDNSEFNKSAISLNSLLSSTDNKYSNMNTQVNQIKEKEDKEETVTRHNFQENHNEHIILNKDQVIFKVEQFFIEIVSIDNIKLNDINKKHELLTISLNRLEEYNNYLVKTNEKMKEENNSLEKKVEKLSKENINYNNQLENLLIEKSKLIEENNKINSNYQKLIEDKSREELNYYHRKSIQIPLETQIQDKETYIKKSTSVISTSNLLHEQESTRNKTNLIEEISLKNKELSKLKNEISNLKNKYIEYSQHKDFEIKNQTIIYENEINRFRNANFQLVNDIIELSSKFQCLKTLLNNDE